MRNTALLAFAAALAGLPPCAAQMQDNQTPSLTCNDTGNRGKLVNHCEMREQTIPSGGRLTIDGQTNGGIQVKGWTRKDVLVRAESNDFPQLRTRTRARLPPKYPYRRRPGVFRRQVLLQPRARIGLSLTRFSHPN